MVSAVSGQRAILFEKFTNAYCGSCAGATEVLKELQVLYPEMIWVSHHSNPGWTDRDLSNPQSDIIQEDLEVYGNPLGMINRTPIDGNLISTPSTWQGLMSTIQSQQSPIQILTEFVAFEDQLRELQIRIGVQVLEQLPAGDYNISIMVVEDKVRGLEQHSYFNDVPGHPLEGRGDIIWDYAHSNVVREVHDGAWGTAGLFSQEPEQGSSVSKDYSITISEDYKLENLSIVAIVANHNLDAGNIGVVDAHKFTFQDLSIVSSTESEIADIDVSIHPNPTSGQLWITSEETINTVEIINSIGQSVIDISKEGNIDYVDVSQLETGIYRCVLMNDEGATVKSLIIE
jgi:hypothetical protein